VARIFFRIFSHGSNIEIPSSHHLGDFWQQNYAEVEGLVHIALKQAKFAVTPFIIRLEHLFLMGDRFQKLEKPSGSAYPGDIFDYPESATPSWSCRTPRLRRFAFVCIVCSVFFFLQLAAVLAALPSTQKVLERAFRSAGWHASDRENLASENLAQEL